MKTKILNYLYKDESDIKLKRRYEICNNILKIKNNETIINLNYNEIARELDLERKTLYNYFKTREELMIVLALMMVEESYIVQNRYIKSRLMLNKNSGIEILTDITPIIKLLKNDSNIKKALFLSNFEHNLYFLSDNEEIVNTYKRSLTFLREQYGNADIIISNAINKNQIYLPKNMTIHEFVIYLEQTILSVYYRTILMENLDDNVSIDIFINHLKLVLSSFSKDHN